MPKNYYGKRKIRNHNAGNRKVQTAGKPTQYVGGKGDRVNGN